MKFFGQFPIYFSFFVRRLANPEAAQIYVWVSKEKVCAHFPSDVTKNLEIFIKP